MQSYHVDHRQRVFSGTGALSALPDALSELAADRVLVVTSPSPARCGVLDRLLSALPPTARATVYDQAREHTPLETIETVLEIARRHEVQAVLGLGGGSSLDTAKGTVLALMAGSTDLRAYQGSRRNLAGLVARTYTAADRAVPLIQVPTTLSAAEATRQAGMTSADGIKEQYFHPAVEATVIVLDPALTTSTPQRLWLSTGIKAMDHAVEQSYSRQASDFSLGLAYQAARNLLTCLPLSREHPDDLEHRAHLQTAAWMAGHAAMRTGAQMGLDHALGHRLGGYFGIPHGIAACVTLPHAMRLNLPGAADRLAGLARWGFGAPTAEGAVDAVAGLIGALGLPTRLREFVPHEDDLRALPELVLSDTGIDGNPRQDLTAGDIAGLLRAAW